MVEISIHEHRVRFHVQGWDKLWSFKSELEIPVEHVLSVRADPEAAGRTRGAGAEPEEILSREDRMLAVLAGAFVSEGWASDKRAGFNNLRHPGTLSNINGGTGTWYAVKNP